MPFFKKKTTETDVLTVAPSEEVALGTKQDFSEEEQKALREARRKRIAEIMTTLKNECAQRKAKQIHEIRQEKFTKEELFSQIRVEILEDRFPEDEELYDTLIEQLDLYLFGYHKLTTLIDDPNISDIAILAYDNVQVKIRGKNKQSNIKFDDVNDYETFVEYIASKNKVDISNINSVQIFTDKINCENYILRFVIVRPMVTSSSGSYVCIRKVPKDFPELEDLMEKDMLTEGQKNYLLKCFCGVGEKDGKGKSIVICGSSASGKTTLLNALKERIPRFLSCLIIQESEELSKKNHPYMMLEHPISNRGEGKVNYTLRELVAAGLLMNVDYFIVGEIKGAEASHLLNASYTGHICGTTVHAENAESALDKLSDYAKYNSDYKKPEIMKMFTSFKTIVFMEHYKIKQILEVEGWDEARECPIYKDVTHSCEEVEREVEGWN